MTKMGSNNASGIVWALGEFFIYFSTPTKNLQYMSGVIYKIRDIGVATMHNRPKRRIWHCLGHWYIAFFFLSCLINSNNCIQILFLFLMAWGKQVMKTVPNDARHIIWAVSKFSYFLSCLIYTNNYIQVLFIFLRALGRWWWRKQAQTMRLALFGQLVSLFK